MGQHDELAVSMLDVGAKLNSLIMACALQPGLGLALEASSLQQELALVA